MPPRKDDAGLNSALITDVYAAREMAVHVDELVLLAQTDSEMQMSCVKFQMEHAAAKASYQPGGGLADDEAHLEAALRRMVDLAIATGGTVLRRAVENSNRGTSPVGRGTSPTTPPTAPPTVSEPTEVLTPTTPTSAASMAEMFRCSSVEDLAVSNSDLCVERNATIMQHSCRVAALVFIVSEKLRTRMQNHALGAGLLDLCRKCLCLPRAVELRYFAEGFKTEHMNVMSNFTYGNAAVCDAVGRDDDFLLAILGATRVDEENPGLVEWAEFTIRNVCGMSNAACDAVKSLKAMSKPAMA